MRYASESEKMVFMSHKTGDRGAKTEAQYIAEKFRVKVYMAEWDENIYDDSSSLPDYIMEAIRRSAGFLVHVIAQISASMWIGYEIGGAHAMQKPRARIMYQSVGSLPSVVGALQSLQSRAALDHWVSSNVL